MIERIPSDKNQHLFSAGKTNSSDIPVSKKPQSQSNEAVGDLAQYKPRRRQKSSRGFLRKIMNGWFKGVETTRQLPGAHGIAVTQGIYNGSRFNLVTIDPAYNEALVYLAPQNPKNHKFEPRRLDVIASKYPKIQIVVNGTYFNHTDGEPDADNQPLGPVLFRDGKYYWTPTTKNVHGKPVYSFNRPFFAIDKDHKPVIDYSHGKRAEAFKKEGYLELLGGGAPLIYDGNIVVSQEALNEAQISPHTHQMDKPRQRTAVGISESGKILIATFGYQGKNGASSSGISLPGLAKFMKNKANARYAMGLDSGTSTGMYIADEKCKNTGIPRKQPTYIIIVDKDTAKVIRQIENIKEKARLLKKMRLKMTKKATPVKTTPKITPKPASKTETFEAEPRGSGTQGPETQQPDVKVDGIDNNIMDFGTPFV